jgi:bifunctional non-homologous end joining protein LigD
MGCRAQVDGARCAARIGGGRAELFSRQANNLSAFFPDVVSGCSAVGHRDVILDGEIIVMDDRVPGVFVSTNTYRVA